MLRGAETRSYGGELYVLQWGLFFRLSPSHIVVEGAFAFLIHLTCPMVQSPVADDARGGEGTR